MAAAPGNGKIYLFGGFVTGNSVYEYDPIADSWSRKAPMPTPRHGLAAAVLDGKIYVAGGSNGSAPSDALEVYDPAKDSWTRLAPPMPTPRVFLAAAALDGKIYAMGGSPDCCGNGRTNAVEIYDTKAAPPSWSHAASLPVALQSSAGAAANGKIYVLGGFIPGQGVQGSTFEYDPAPGMQTWTFRATMLDPRPGPRGGVDGRGRECCRGDPHVLGGSVDCHCKARGTQSSYTPSTTTPPIPIVDLSSKNRSLPPAMSPRGGPSTTRSRSPTRARPR